MNIYEHRHLLSSYIDCNAKVIENVRITLDEWYWVKMTTETGYDGATPVIYNAMQYFNQEYLSKNFKIF